ncbi:MAG: flagellar hook-associated protein FlgL [Gammaproteobacteria bacterium]|nr:MAG: flagellar hook-associated protein FlgL [Gammaproteobacteria bacterium]
MRVSTRLYQDTGVNAMLEQQAKVSKTQLQLASGRRILAPSDDPSGSARVLQLRQSLSITDQFQINANTATSRLQLEESVLNNITNALQRVRELAVNGSNDINSNVSRGAIAVEVRQLLEEVLMSANSRDANGEYLFAGFQGLTQPFSRDASGNYLYAGDEGQRFVQIGPNRQIAMSDSGTEVFRAIQNGNGVFTTRENAANTGTGIMDPGSVNGSFVRETYTITFTQVLPTDPITYGVTDSTAAVIIPAGTAYQEGADITFNGVRTNIKGTPADGDSFTVSPSVNQDIFTTIDNLAVTLETGAGNDAGRAHFANAVNRFLTDIDQTLTRVLETETNVGARMNAIDSQFNINDAYSLQLKGAISLIEDLDYAEASSRLNLQLVGLQAAQQSFIRIQGLSLFNYL